MDKQARIRIRALTKVIKGRTIVKDLNLDLYPGEVFGLIGPNGAGKTTTIKMLVGLSKITSGDVFYEDKDYKKDFVEIKRHIGTIVENPDLYNFMPGDKLLKLFSGFYPEIEPSRVDEVIRLVKMEEAAHRPPKVYSLGMKQRLALALALLQKPEFLILDEPTNGLDPQGIREMRILLRELAEKENVTVLVSSHILGEMQALCDRVGLIHHGELLYTGSVQEFSQDMGESRIRILCDKPAELLNFFVEKGIGCERNNGYVTVSCEMQYINHLLRDIMDGGFMIYAVEPVHASLEDSFMKLVNEKGAVIR